SVSWRSRGRFRPTRRLPALLHPSDSSLNSSQPCILHHHRAMKKYVVRPGQKVALAAIDPDETELAKDKEHGARRFAALQTRLAELQEMLFARQEHKVLIVLQGMDTSGKDGAIRHVAGSFNPQGVRVVSFKQPTEEELAHDFL